MISKPEGVSADVPATRGRQLAYSQLQVEMLDEAARRQKTAKIIAVLRHFLGREDLSGLRALDIGSSMGFISDELQKAGAQVTGIDIDEPGFAAARQRFGDRVEFVSADGAAIPAKSQAFDIVVFNHIYEHVVDADAVICGDPARVAPRWGGVPRVRQSPRNHGAALPASRFVVAAQVGCRSLHPS